MAAAYTRSARALLILTQAASHAGGAGSSAGRLTAGRNLHPAVGNSPAARIKAVWTRLRQDVPLDSSDHPAGSKTFYGKVRCDGKKTGRGENIKIGPRGKHKSRLRGKHKSRRITLVYPECRTCKGSCFNRMVLNQIAENYKRLQFFTATLAEKPGIW